MHAKNTLANHGDMELRYTSLESIDIFMFLKVYYAH